MAALDHRIHERARETLRNARLGRVVVLATVAAVVLVNTMADAFAGFYLLRDEIENYRAWAVFSNGLTTVINIILVFLVWVLFETLGRVERESDRVQTFMDNTYRRLP